MSDDHQPDSRGKLVAIVNILLILTFALAVIMLLIVPATMEAFRIEILSRSVRGSTSDLEEALSSEQVRKITIIILAAIAAGTSLGGLIVIRRRRRAGNS